MIDDKVLRRLQLTQLEILKVIDAFCSEHGIPYSLYAGTTIGAVRHKGFIPWDDDLDICMTRSDYERFIRLWEAEKPAGYLLQNKENSPRFTQSFTKIRKDHTTFLQDEWERGAYHLGIFVDVFPVDRMPPDKWHRWLFFWHCMQYQLFTREFVPPKGNRLVKCMSKCLLAITPADRRANKREKLLKKIAQYRDCKSYPTVFIETVGSMKKPQPADLMDHLVRVPFEDSEFYCFAKSDEYLTRHYGDYMQLPPESERGWQHHPIILDFEHNYEELNLPK